MITEKQIREDVALAEKDSLTFAYDIRARQALPEYAKALMEAMGMLKENHHPPYGQFDAACPVCRILAAYYQQELQ